MAGWARREAQRKGLVDLERRCQDISREIQMLNKRQEIFQNAIEDKLRVQERASERMQDRIIEEIKELVHRKTEEALRIAVKEHDLWMYQDDKEEAKRLQGVRKLRKDGNCLAGLGRGKKDGKWRVEAGARRGSGSHEQVEAKLSRRRSEMLYAGEEIRSLRQESDSDGIRRNTGLCERRKECGAGRGGREDLRTERGERSATAAASL